MRGEKADALVSAALSEDLAHLLRVLQLSPAHIQHSLQTLGADLAARVPSFAGLTLTVVVEEQPVTLLAMVPGTGTEAVHSSLAFRLAPGTRDTAGGHLVFYARDPGALAALAATLSDVQGVADEGLEIDRHLSPPARSGITGVEELSLVNRAVGVLVGRGRTVADARRHLRHTAQKSELQEFQVAAYLVSTTE